MRAFKAAYPDPQDTTFVAEEREQRRIPITFEVVFSVALFRRIKGLLGIDLLNPSLPASASDSRTVVQVVLQDLEQFVNVAFLACEKQAAAAGVSDLQFGELLDDPTFLACRQAVLEEWEDFFARAGVTATAALLRKQREVFVLAGSKIDQIPATSMMGPVEQELQSLIAGLTSTNSPA